MNSVKKSISQVFKGGLFIAALLGILIQCGVFSGELNLSVLNYYTLISNLLCALYFGAASVKALRRDEILWPHFKGALMMGITVSGLVYHFMLAGSFQMQGTMALSNLLLHYVVPAMAVLDWLIFDPKGRFTWKSPFVWAILPNAYFVYAVIRVALGASLGYGGNRYPYPFLNADALGWPAVLFNVLILNAAFLLLGFVYVALDWGLAKVRDTISLKKPLTE